MATSPRHINVEAAICTQLAASMAVMLEMEEDGKYAETGKRYFFASEKPDCSYFD